MRKALSSILVWSFLSLLFVGCQVSVPKEVIQPDRMENLLFDYHMAQVMNNELPSLQGSQHALILNFVFEKNSIARADFDSSMVWYARNPAYLYQIYANLQERLDRDIELLEETKLLANNVSLEGDTVDLWPWAKVRWLNATALNRRVKFDTKSDSTYMVGDSILFSFVAHFIALPAEKEIWQRGYASLSVSYKDSTKVNKAVLLDKSGRYLLSLPRDEEREIDKIKCFIYYNDLDSTLCSALLVGDLSLLRIHPQKEDDTTPKSDT